MLYEDMTVSDLIETLKRLPSDYLVTITGNDGFWIDIDEPNGVVDLYPDKEDDLGSPDK